MSRFYAEIQGTKGEATRIGTSQSGIQSHTRGWNVGCEVYCSVDPDGNDVIDIYRTGGSNGGRIQHIARLTETHTETMQSKGRRKARYL